MPLLARDTAPPQDLEARARRDEIVARTAGLRPSLAYVVQTYGGEWEPVAEPAPAPPPGDDRRLASPTDPPRPDPPPPPATARDAGGTPAPRDRLFAANGADDPIPDLAARTRETLGPLVDRWADRIRDGIANADTLAAARDRLDEALAWTADPRAPTPEVADAAGALAPALAAAQLAGRYDVEGDRTGPALASPTAIALASAAAQHTQRPFDEQIAFFRSKLDLTTRTWTDIWQEQHDRAFVVAGAAHADLLTDLRAAVDKAIADGATIDTFRKDFDSLVARHGWSYNGGRDWRTRVIYATNLRTSYAAGRYRQMKDIAGRRPYWRYRHSDASEEPRHAHLAWDGLVLRHDAPWWATHYPPNGWGCKCFVETLDDAGLERLGKSGPDQAPEIRTRTVTVGVNGPSPRTVAVPQGIDPGWAYAPGRTTMPPTRNRPAPDYKPPLFAPRQPLPDDFPKVPVVTTIGNLKKQPGYEAAKRGGDTRAAMAIARTLLRGKRDRMLAPMRARIGEDAGDVIVMPVALREGLKDGANRLPLALAYEVADGLGAKTPRGKIVQANIASHTGASLADRALNIPAFDGPVVPGRRYVLVDDVVTSGSTLLELAAYIHARGGKVVGAASFAAGVDGTILKATAEVRRALRAKHGEIENDFRAAFGYGFDALSQREARNFARQPAARLRGIVAARSGRSARRDDPDTD